MSWTEKLYETYENCTSLVGVAQADGKLPLLPIAHTTQNAQIEVTVDGDGNFVSANMVDKNDSVTIIPCTEKSATRTGNNEPHPLHDKLEFVAGDYMQFGGDKRKGAERYLAYVDALEKWSLSEYTHPKISAILTYLSKKTLIEDLIKSGLLIYDPDKNSLKDSKDNKDQIDAFVRFRVFITGDDGDDRIWLDKNIWDCYINYLLSGQSESDMCYVSGKVIPCSDSHPAKIRNTGDKAKLISSNDSSGFTYRGRFTSDKQVVRVGYETSQKIHNALKWLVEKQGFKCGEQAIVAWGIKNENLPKMMADSDEAFFCGEEKPDTFEEFAKRLNQAISGYKYDLQGASEIVVMALDSATTGRLSITYYRQLEGSDFLSRIENWHRTCVWEHTKLANDGFDEKGKQKFKRITFIGAPSPADIAKASYGERVDDRLKKEVNERLLHCIIDGEKLQADILNAVFNRAVNPVAAEPYAWEKTLSVFCALYRKFKINQEEFQMALDEKRTTRDYLYGRLLAIADKLERATFDKDDKSRETNAMRYMNMCAQHPYKTWAMIHERLLPYISKLGGLRGIYEAQLSEVQSMFRDEDFMDNRPMKGEYILGFWCQSKAIDDEIARRAAEKKNS
ncbi:MAG: type I-C CRISPR-associated protein Cas8c/Csd1 [Bacillota bacterium]|nr:type I-C CRISPR-associated protein Cas8c/Csd1 [Bacillota bacterium]